MLYIAAVHQWNWHENRSQDHNSVFKTIRPAWWLLYTPTRERRMDPFQLSIARLLEPHYDIATLYTITTHYYLYIYVQYDGIATTLQELLLHIGTVITAIIFSIAYSSSKCALWTKVTFGLFVKSHERLISRRVRIFVHPQRRATHSYANYLPISSY